MIIRTLTERDLEQIKAIDRAAFPEDDQYEGEMYWQMLQSGVSIVASDDNGAIVGYAFVQINAGSRIRSIAVHPDFQRKGYGKAMMRAVIDGADREVDLLVDEANGPAVRLYRSLGFQPVEMCLVPPKRRMLLKTEKS